MFGNKIEYLLLDVCGRGESEKTFVASGVHPK